MSISGMFHPFINVPGTKTDMPIRNVLQKHYPNEKILCELLSNITRVDFTKPHFHSVILRYKFTSYKSASCDFMPLF